jgi:SAM-dependent methyltransferase
MTSAEPPFAERLRQRVRRLRRPAWLAWLRGQPVSREWGRERGAPLDRYYIERFLGDHVADIHGRVLEVRDRTYTERFGRGVTSAEVLDIDPTNPLATHVADLAAADAVPADAFDCVILTQTLQYVFDVGAAVRHVHRMLRPGGVLLCTVPAVSRLAARYAAADCWRFTPAGCRRLFGQAFDPSRVDVRSFGNLAATLAFLQGRAGAELSPPRLWAEDPEFPVIIAVRAEKGRVA